MYLHRVKNAGTEPHARIKRRIRRVKISGGSIP